MRRDEKRRKEKRKEEMRGEVMSEWDQYKKILKDRRHHSIKWRAVSMLCNCTLIAAIQ
jgi:hypothetical protein